MSTGILVLTAFSLFAVINSSFDSMSIAIVASFHHHKTGHRSEVNNFFNSVINTLNDLKYQYMAIYPNSSHHHEEYIHNKCLNSNSKCHVTHSSLKNSTGYFLESKEIIARFNPSIIWSFGEWSLDRLSDLNIPMIITISPTNFERITKSHQILYQNIIKSRNNIWYRFVSEDMWYHYVGTHSDLLYKSFLIHHDTSEVKYMLNASHHLLNMKKPPIFYDYVSLPQVIVASSVTHDRHSVTKEISNNIMIPPMIYIGERVFDIFNVSAFNNDIVGDKQLLVGTMSTTPKRLNEINGPLGETIRRILSFPMINRLYLNIPWFYELRKKSDLIELPGNLTNLMNEFKGRLRVLRSRDYGPSTKLLPTLMLSDIDLPLNSMIITFDDDRLYNIDTVNSLVSNSILHPEAVITNAAWPIDILSARGRRGIRNGPTFHSRIRKGTEGIQYQRAGYVDLLLGFYGVLYVKKFFSPLPFDLFNYNIDKAFVNHCAWVDDIWFSGHLEKMSIPRWTIGKVPNTGADITSLSNVNALSLDMGESVKQNQDNVRCAEAMRNLYGIWK